ncbi:hypothetical protein A1O3_07609 [Capronia epimyces CBS 606.96]|uniref:SET domain-containing protein n=1 Tax=Capronia epimyces CBS 606.96 TaxID=1182542 RepID=W9YGA1_9EURO|nr:uncharacterized protein A1O3_07609 [Capronia epimyces CBS 606.96]EXJ81319.1 hypothetical protein A1O3_07609 [Capronia epimyces CBS 606.96]
MVVKLKLRSDKRPNKGSIVDIASSEHESITSVNKPNGFLDRNGVASSPPGSGGRPAARVVSRLENSHGVTGESSRRVDDVLIQQNTSDSETHASEHEHHADDEDEASALLSIPRFQRRIEANVQEMESLMEEVHKQLQAWQEMSVQANLRRATAEMRTYPRPRLDSSAGDPFRAITEQRRSGLGAEPRPQDKSQNKKLAVIRTPEHAFWTGATLLPKYKSIGRVSRSFLAPNYRTAKYRPYDAEDEIQDPDATEKYAELEQRFNNNYPGLKSQRQCQELVWLWQPWAEELFVCLGISKSDVLYFFTQDHFDPDRELTYAWSAESSKAWREEQMRRCRTCELADPESRWSHFSETFNSLPKPSNRSLALAGLVAHAFHQRTRVSLWHVAIGGLLQPRYEDPQTLTRRAPNFCVLCFRHHCPDHGSYEEPNNEDVGAKDAEELKAYINDEEQNHNLRKFMSLPVRNRHDSPKHMCGVFCVEPSQKLSQLIGRRIDGTITGHSRKVSPAKQVLADDEFCSSSCFWDVTTRRDIQISDVKFEPFMSQSQKLLVDKLIRFYLNNKRGPCLISRIIKDILGRRLTVARLSDTSITRARRRNRCQSLMCRGVPSWTSGRLLCRARTMALVTAIRPALAPGVRYTVKDFVDVTNLARDAFAVVVAPHEGLNRECDPSLCGKCGVVEVLDSANKYKDDVRRGRCRNNRIQLGLPAPTTKAPSQVQGYGLYSRADIASGEFIGEYTGEIVSISEGDRRGAMYHVLNQEYLFVINRGQEIDASNNGNKMRFMNNSQLEENINVEPKKLLCSGVVRVGLFAKRFVKAGEELLYNYNYPESVVKNFWEPGERPSSGRRLIPTGSERIARTTGANKLADENVNEMREESSQSPLPRHTKRKRAFEESLLASHRFDALSNNDDESENSTLDIQTAPEVDDSEDPDYESNSLAYDEGDMEDDADQESDLEAVETQPRQTRRSSNRRPLPGGEGLGRHISTSKSMGGSRSRGRSAQRIGRNQSRSHSGTSSSATMNSRRRRKIGPHDKRLGGQAQQQAWRTRRLRESLGLSMSPSTGSA